MAFGSNSNDMPRRTKRGKAIRALAGLEGAFVEPVNRMPDVDLRGREDWVPDGAQEVTGREQYRVEYHLFQTRPTDTENPYTKAMTDQLRYHGLIPGDSPYQVKVVVRQFKVKHKNQEGTKIVIIKLYE